MTLGRFRHQGYTLGYEVHGAGDRVVVLTNGLLLDASVNRPLARSLAAQGYRVVLLDLLGHGTSDKPPHATLHRMDRYARQVVALLDELGIERAGRGSVCGGGAKACIFAFGTSRGFSAVKPARILPSLPTRQEALFGHRLAVLVELAELRRPQVRRRTSGRRPGACPPAPGTPSG